MSDAESTPSTTSLASLGRPALLAAALGASVLVVSLLQSSLSPGEAIGSLAIKLGAIWPALAYIAAACGLAWPARRIWSPDRSPSPDADAIQLALGLALMCSATHLLGVLGLLGPPIAIGLVLLGLGLLGVQLARGFARRASGGVFEWPSPIWILAAPSGAVLVVATLMPPGWLWASEFGGYDALSYHLQLPQEWIEMGRIAPVEHNIYSYLPGYMESAFAHLGWLTMASAGGLGLVDGDGWRLLSCHALHAGFALCAAWLTLVATRRIAQNAEMGPAAQRLAGFVGGSLALATPWAVVTGSLAYNEAGVNAMLAGALVVCTHPSLSPLVRGVLVGALIGVACGFKPTALFFAGLPAGILLCVSLARSQAPLAAGLGLGLISGAVAGTIALTPWLLRNAMHGGNPVFPFATDLFGNAHWTTEQVKRYADAHQFVGSLGDRVQTLFWVSPSAAPDAPAIERFRGLANPQWGLLAVFVPGAIALLMVSGARLRSQGVLLAQGLVVQLLAWMFLTHLQSRFLLPLLPIAACVVGLGVGRLRDLADARPDTRAGAALLAGVLVLTQTGFLLATYAAQPGGSPGTGLAIWPGVLTDRASEDPTPAGWSHQRPEGSGQVYLLGDATPLYFAPGVRYHTTYDTSPLGDLVRAYPDEPDAWVRNLREQGVGWVLVSESELSRLTASGWYDPEVTPESAQALFDRLGRPVRVWPEERRYVFRVPAP